MAFFFTPDYNNLEVARDLLATRKSFSIHPICNKRYEEAAV